MLTKKEKKEYVFKKLDEILKPQGYYLVKTGLDPLYVLKENNYIVNVGFNFKDMGQIAFSKIFISIKCVEEIIFEIKKPNQDYSFIDNKKYFLLTVFDGETKMPDGYYRGIGYDINSQEDLVFFTEWILNYLKTDGQKFIETYSYLPNILKKMDELTAQGKTWQNRENGILSGSLDAEFRGLIIAKLCNDPNFQKKVEMCDTVFNESCYEEWLPYYEKLKERLKSVEPIYNV
ncbi:hypothetical protein [Capnocytophaga sputigena]|uniref:hypothetical protein n=1 Tax=Capnocytophaga sputigena TaxID=1019 RepID=UPI0028E8A33C|nr:hypothetical protein [Capnocytophaga sputigena]